jgi:hypothetical protein
VGKEKLKSAVDRAFGEGRIEETLRNSPYGVADWRLNLPALTDALPGGSCAPGERFDVNFQLSFNALPIGDQKEVEEYYGARVSAIDQKWHDRFPKAFGKLK